MVEKQSSDAGDVSLIPGWGTRIPLASGQLCPCTAATEAESSRVYVPAIEKPASHD